jgi:hypothetical protein
MCKVGNVFGVGHSWNKRNKNVPHFFEGVNQHSAPPIIIFWFHFFPMIPSQVSQGKLVIIKDRTFWKMKCPRAWAFCFSKCLTYYGGKNPLNKTSYKYSKKFRLVLSGSKIPCSKMKSFGVWLQRQFNSAFAKPYFLHAFVFCVPSLSWNPSKKKQKV